MPRCLSFDFSKDSLRLDDSGRYGPFCCGDRLARLTLEKGPLTLDLNLAGIYDSEVLTRNGTDFEASSLSRESDPVIRWRSATFVGRHWLLGSVLVELDPDRSSTGSFALAESSQPGFYPARNRNEFWFRVRVPRFNRTYASAAPVINEATVTSIPPIGALYQLEAPVRFTNQQNPGDWVDITKCWVMMPDQKWITIDVTSIVRRANRFDVEATLQNVSPVARVPAYWFTNSDEPQVHYKPRTGYLFLGRKPRPISFSMMFSQAPTDPVIQIGAAVITNPRTNDPDSHGGTLVAAFNVNRRMAFLRSRGTGSAED